MEGPRRFIGTGLMGVGIALAVILPSRLDSGYAALGVFLGIFMAVIGGLMRRRPPVQKNPQLHD